jgi:hypothetical protein
MTPAIEYKGYNIVGDGTYGHKEIKTIGKGSLPLQLRGSFTTSVFAQKAIDAYLHEKGSKEA